MLLSIVMIVKNEEKYLDKTLFALNALKKNINSELIILDTGSTDNTVNIAKKYTDKVYFEKWNNNFADMRNKSISYAKGDWILVLDADEVLSNLDKLVQFFRTDLYKKYNSATIELMNINSEDELEYNLVSIPRLFKNENGFCYIGAVHEQPKFKLPLYNDIASFKHYGYMFKDKELLNKKYLRNGEILLKEIEKSPNDPYINYQLGKNYCILKSYEDALFYLERSLELYRKRKHIPRFLTSNLAQLYISMNQYRKCENLCLDYIKEDNKNIDIYYALGISQAYLEKKEESIESFERYLYLIENYNISTQANNIDTDCLTIRNKEDAKVIIFENYYKLERYKDAVNYSKCINENNLSKIYYMLIHSVYKLGESEEIKNIYINLTDDIERSKFIDAIEIFINNIKEVDKKIIYKYFSNIDNNYGKLNRLRLGEQIDVNESIYILKNENRNYFGDLIYYLTKTNINLYEIVKDISLYKLEIYLTYLIQSKNDMELILYEYIDQTVNTLEVNKLKLESTICKLLCKHSNLLEDKYKKVFLTYIVYRNNYLQSIYNVDKIKCNLCDIVNNKDDKFALDLYNILNLKKNNTLSFIRNIKNLLKEYPEYKKGMQYLLNDIEKDILVSDEMNILKKEYKSIIEKIIASNNLSKAIEVVSQYEDMFGNEEMYNIRAIINLYLGNIQQSERLLKLSYINDPLNVDTIFNIAYTKEISGDYDEAISFYEKLLSISEDEDLKNEVVLKLNTLIG